MPFSAFKVGGMPYKAIGVWTVNFTPISS